MGDAFGARLRPALAMTTAKYGNRTAPASRAHRSHPDAMIAPRKHTVRMAIDTR